MILRTDDHGSPEKRQSFGPLFVNKTRFTNSAVKFWFGLAIEVKDDFPACTAIELSTCCSDSLSPDLLFPETALEKDIERLASSDAKEEMQRILDELDILGPPAPVTVRLLAGEQEILNRELPQEIIDSEILSSLLVWPLKWSDIPEDQWNGKSIEGRVIIEARRSPVLFDMTFKLRKEEISEGLFRRSIVVNYSATVKTTDP